MRPGIAQLGFLHSVLHGCKQGDSQAVLEDEPGKNLFPSSFRLSAEFSPCTYEGEVSVSCWLSAKGESQLLEAAFMY